MQNPQIAGIMGKKQQTVEPPTTWEWESGGSVPYSPAKALVKSANKGSKQAEKLHK